MSFTLYPHQQSIIQATRRELIDHDSVVMVAPTGFGKTVVTGFMLASAQRKDRRAVFCVHRDELLAQSVETLRATGVEPGIIAAGYDETPGALVQVASVKSLVTGGRLLRTPAPDLLVMDESQHMPAASWRKVRECWSGSKLVGLTATPCRLDGCGLGEHFRSMVEGPDVEWLIRHNYLAPYRAFGPLTGPCMAGIIIQRGDFARSPTEWAMNKPTITGDAVRTYLKHTPGKQALVFCVGIKHSISVAEAFRRMGITACHLGGDTPRDERRAVMASFRAGQIQVLTNVDLFSEGLDVPGVEVGIFLRPTVSVALWRQQVGRILRYQPGKTAWLFDHAGNFERHGLPDDKITWSLDGVVRAPRDGSAAMSVRTCGSCYAVSRASAKACERCGTAFPLTPREVKKLDGDLAEINRARARIDRAVEKRAARTLEELTALGKQRGYKNARFWAMKQLEFRERKRG